MKRMLDRQVEKKYRHGSKLSKILSILSFYRKDDVMTVKNGNPLLVIHVNYDKKL